MRGFSRTLLLLLLIAAIFPFVFPWKDGKPLLSWSELKVPGIENIEIPDIPDIPLPGIKEDDEATRKPHEAVKLYRWQAADGSMQFSNEPPRGVAYEIVEVHPDANIIQPQPLNAPDSEGDADSGSVEEKSLSIPSPLTVTPGEAMQLLEETRRLKEMSQERQQHEAVMQ
jgi:hypothetical protein